MQTWFSSSAIPLFPYSVLLPLGWDAVNTDGKAAS